MIQVVVVYRLEHLSADLTELAKIIEVLYEHKVTLVSLNPLLNTSEPAGRLAVSLLLSFTGFESKLNSETQARAAPATPQPPEYENSFRIRSRRATGFGTLFG